MCFTVIGNAMYIFTSLTSVISLYANFYEWLIPNGTSLMLGKLVQFLPFMLTTKMLNSQPPISINVKSRMRSN